GNVNISAHPNAGLPNAFGEYDQSPQEMEKYIQEYLNEGLVQIIGGCCGTTPQHIHLIYEAVEQYNASLNDRNTLKKEQSPTLKLSGLEPLIVAKDSNFINIGERTNVTGSRKFLRLIKENK